MGFSGTFGDGGPHESGGIMSIKTSRPVPS